MFNYVWPIALIVLSNTFYQICAKSVPEKMNPFASLTVTYLIGAFCCAVLFFVTQKQHLSFFKELSKVNWAPFVLGFVIVGLEAGYIYAYKVGWQVSVVPIVQSAFLAVILIFVGFALYKEKISPNKIFGIVICLIGLFFINKK